MKTSLYLCLGALALTILASLFVLKVDAHSAQGRAASEPSFPSVEALLNPDGSLNLTTGFNGSLDVRGWRMSLAANGAPHFSRAAGPRDGTNNAPALKPASVPDDVYWDGRFDYPPGVNGSFPDVLALAVSANDLYVGGLFTTTGSISVRNIAKWNPAIGWSSLGNGMNGAVYALAVSGGNVFAGGVFTQVCGDITCTIGNTTVRNIATWNGSSWSALGNGVDSSVLALAVSGSNVYAGGSFFSVCADSLCLFTNTIVHNIAVWNGSSWSALGNGVDNNVLALAASGSNLYAGGAFTNVCGNPCGSGDSKVNNIAVWNGSSWAALGNGVSGQVNALAVNAGNLYAGGNFLQVCGNLLCNFDNTTVDHIAARIGGSWSGLGSGMNDNVLALGADGSNLYVGGAFTSAGGKPSFRFAHWNKSLFIYLPLIEK